MAKKYRVIAGGIYSGEKELQKGETITLKDDPPAAWASRLIEISSTEGKEPVTNPEPVQPTEPVTDPEPTKTEPPAPSKK